MIELMGSGFGDGGLHDILIDTADASAVLGGKDVDVARLSPG